MFFERAVMRGRTIPFVRPEGIFGMKTVEVPHMPIAYHLRGNRSERNDLLALIATDDGLLVFVVRRSAETSVEEYARRCRVGGEARERAVEREVNGGDDTRAVNVYRTDERDGKREEPLASPREHLCVPLLPRTLRELF